MADLHDASPDPEDIARFWALYLASEGLDPATPHLEPWCFGGTTELANELLDLVINGPKRGTASCVEEYEIAGEALPKVGDLSIVFDGSMQPKVVLKATDIRIGPLSSVDDQFAWDEGEGDRSRSYWLDVHTTCFTQDYERLGLEFHPDIPVVFERFDLVYTAPEDNS